AEKALATVLRGAADRREGLARLAGQVGARRSRLEATEAEIGRLRETLTAAERRGHEATVEFTALETRVAGVEEGEEDLDAAHEAAAEAVGTASARVAELTAQLTEADRERSALESRIETLELSLTRKDGAGALLAADDLAGVVGSVAALLGVAAGDEDAIVAALGASADAVAVDSVEAAVDAIRWLREQDAGRAGLVVAAGDAVDAGDADQGPAPAGSGWALDLVQAPPAVVPAVRRLLRGVVVVDDLVAARGVLRDRPDLVVATRAGDVLAAHRASGGSATAPSALHLQSALDDARQGAEAAAARAEQARFGLVGAREAEEEARAEYQRTLDELNESDAALAAVAEQLGHLGATARAARNEAERVQASLAAAEQTLAAGAAELAGLTERLAAAEAEPADTDAAIEERTGERDAVRLELSEAASEAQVAGALGALDALRAAGVPIALD
ncbi:chromosome segregation protein SMC, partial [Cellulomonas hominis]